MNISKEQQEIITAPIDEKTIVMSSAAAGKTFCVTERLRYLIRNNVNPKKIVAVTFTNNAAAEMRKRLGEDNADGMFVGTLHSYANYLLTINGIDTSSYLNEEDFDGLFELIEEHPEVLQEIDYLLCDESQDLNPQQFSFIFTLIRPEACLIVGDVRQSIYGFRGAEPKQLLSLTNDEDFVVRQLSQNYRNGKLIVNYSNSIVNRMKFKGSLNKVTAMRENDGLIKLLLPQITSITSLVKSHGKPGDWAILSRTNAGVAKIIAALTKAGVPCETFRQAQNSLDDLNSILENDTVKVLTIHSSKGLEFNNVVVHDAFTHGEEALRLFYVAVTRAKNELYICGQSKF